MSHRKQKKTESFGAREVERLATLARLSLSPAEVDRFRTDLSSILDYFATIDRVDVSKAPSQASDGVEAVREDLVRPSTADEILEGVPLRKDRYVRAPRVF